MNKSGLLIRLALVLIFSSLAVGVISAQLFYRLTYLNEVKTASQEITQLYQTVSSTASVAAYLVDNELAKEMVTGLATNGIVHGAIIKTDQSEISSTISSDNEPLIFKLYSPFEKERLVGELHIIPDLDYIESRAKKIGTNNAKALIVQALVVTLIAIFVAFTLITKPMINIANDMHKITPGTEGRLDVPDFHENSELGDLVRDINNLLHQTQNQLSAERVLRKELEVLEKRFRILFENSVSPIVLMEPRGNILLYNDAFSSMLSKMNIHFKKNFGPLLKELLDAPEQLTSAVQNSFANDEISTGEYKLNQQVNSENIWIQMVVTSIMSDDMKEYYQLTLHDISKRKKELDLLNKRANFDQLTKLLNRHSAELKIVEYMADNTPFAIVLMDLNGFKKINDVYGHETGDEILIYVAAQLKKGIRRDDLACRWGGDEFVLVLRDIDHNNLEIICQKILTHISKDHYLTQFDKNISVGASLGISFFPQDEINMQELINLADQAMYQAKRNMKQGESNGIMFSSENPDI